MRAGDLSKANVVDAGPQRLQPRAGAGDGDLPVHALRYGSFGAAFAEGR